MSKFKYKAIMTVMLIGCLMEKYVYQIYYKEALTALCEPVKRKRLHQDNVLAHNTLFVKIFLVNTEFPCQNIHQPDPSLLPFCFQKSSLH